MAEAVAAAEARNPAVAEAEARVEQARGRATTARQRVPSRPELAISLQTDAPFAGTGEKTFDLSLSQELELFGQRGLRMRSAAEDLAARSLAVADERRRIRADTRVAYYELMFNENQPREAQERYSGAEYRQHNPGVGDGKEAFIVLQVIPEAAANDNGMF